MHQVQSRVDFGIRKLLFVSFNSLRIENNFQRVLSEIMMFALNLAESSLCPILTHSGAILESNIQN